MAGIVHFANYYRYMEQAEHDYFRSLHLSIMEKHSDGTVVGWPRVSCSCKFKAPAFYEDVLEVRISVLRIGVKSLTFHFDFWREETHIASGQAKTVCCILKPGCPLESIEIPERYLAVIHEASRTS